LPSGVSEYNSAGQQKEAKEKRENGTHEEQPVSLTNKVSLNEQTTR